MIAMATITAPLTIEQFLQLPVRVAYPKHRTLWTHHADGISRLLKEDQHLEEPQLLPGFRVLVSDFFEGI